MLAVGLGLTIAAWRYAETDADAGARRHFDVRTSEITAAIVGRMAVYEQMLRGGLGLFLASKEVTAQDWRRYADSLSLEHTLPGVLGFGYTKWVPAAELPTLAGAARRLGVADFEFKPPGPRDDYTAILYLEPLNRRNREAIGFDMWSQPVRRAAMAAARDLAGPVVSGGVRLIQEIDEDVQAGFLMYLPHYATPGPPDSIEARRRSLLGFVYSPFRMRDFMDGIDYAELRDVRVRIFDGAAALPEALMYDSGPGDVPGDAPPFAETVSIALPGHLWTASFTALPAAVWQPHRARSAILLGAGTLISLLFFGVVWTLARSRRMEALNARLGLIIEESASEVYVFEPAQLRFIQANRGARANLGYTIDELRRLTPLDLAPALTRTALEALLQPLRDRRETQTRARTEIRRKDGSTYAAEIELQLSRSTRPPVFIAIVQDITERRRAEEHQRLLMDELNHRVKNTLAVVQSLAARTVQGSASPTAFVQTFKGRLAALAASHTLLTQTYWNGAALGDLVREHLEPYRGSGRAGMPVEGPPILLKPAAALALGLALHELATNAAKHGALSAPKGEVRVDWRVEPGDSAPLLVLNWIESGGPPVPACPGRGFGRTVIERGLAYELDGRVELDFGGDGLRCRIAIPLREATTAGPRAPTAPLAAG